MCLSWGFTACRGREKGFCVSGLFQRHPRKHREGVHKWSSLGRKVHAQCELGYHCGQPGFNSAHTSEMFH